MEPIYVQIPAYRDQELARTLIDLYAKSSQPKRIRVHVLWQRDEGECLPQVVKDLPNLKITDVLYTESMGCNWARSVLQEAWHDEPYTLLLDSHHRFVSHWDQLLIDMYHDLRKSGVNKPLITAYLPSYEPEREPGARKRRPYKMYPLGREDGLLTKLTSYPISDWKRLMQPVIADYVSLHFIFTAGSINEELRIDPSIYFFGDEVVTSLRAYTSGFDFFHPHRLVAWHCYNRTSRIAHWDDHTLWYKKHQSALVTMRQLFRGSYEGLYGLGKVRTIQDYENHIMIPLIQS